MGAIKERMKQDLAIRGLSENTQQSYLTCVKQFVGHFMISPERLGLNDIRSYQLYLIRERNVAESSFNVHVAALKFLYGITLQRNWNLDLIPYHRKSKRLPVVLSREEVVQLYHAVSSLKHKAIVLTLYSTGLRVSELVHLKIHDIDSSRMLVRVQEGKNRKDRYVGLSPKLLELLRQYWRSTTPSPRTWLFPGDSPGHPLTRCGGGEDDPQGQRAGRDPQTREPPYAASFLRNPSAGVGSGYTKDTAHDGPRKSAFHCPVPSRRQHLSA